MAKVFLDTNIFIDSVYRNPETREQIHGHDIFISPLSIHILCYVNKIALPNKEFQGFLENYIIIHCTKEIFDTSLYGPTSDLEDNIQLHSAAEEVCDVFLTLDKKLLAMKYFGKTKILSSMEKYSHH